MAPLLSYGYLNVEQDEEKLHLYLVFKVQQRLLVSNSMVLILQCYQAPHYTGTSPRSQASAQSLASHQSPTPAPWAQYSASPRGKYIYYLSVLVLLSSAIICFLQIFLQLTAMHSLQCNNNNHKSLLNIYKFVFCKSVHQTLCWMQTMQMQIMKWFCLSHSSSQDV